jgi:hypothetical protein
MSYIRCTSNPEELYVWSDGENVHFRCRQHGERELSMPTLHFENLMRKWKRTCISKVESGGASLSEVRLPTGEKFGGEPLTEERYRLTYRNWNGDFIDAYKVTFWYIACNVGEKKPRYRKHMM